MHTSPNIIEKARVEGGLDELVALGIVAYPLPGTSYHEAILELPIDGGTALGACELLRNISGARSSCGRGVA